MESRGTDKEVLANRQDMIITNEKDEICILREAAIPSDSNVIQKLYKAQKFR
jgi:hypothetical protein